MQAVHDKAYHLISDGLKQDTITRFRDKILPQLSTRITSENNTTTSNESTPKLTSPLDEFKNELPPAFMVAIGSNPGAGKTSLVGALHETFLRSSTTNIEQKHASENENQHAKISKEEEKDSSIINVVISEIHILPMDGYHRYRSELAVMNNPEEAFRRRGAPFTFNDEKYAANSEQLRKSGKLNAPAFAHSKKDPEEDFYKIDVSCRYSFSSFSSDNGRVQHYTIYRPLVIVEGLYCLFDEGEFWRHAVNQFDMKFFLKINIDVATERLTKRHMRAWGISEEEARDRAAGSDRDNGLMVIARATAMAERKECIVLESVDDEEFAKKFEKYSC